MDGEHTHTCVVCQRRQYERAQVCEPCRGRIADDLDEIAVLHPLLSAAAVTLGTDGGIPLRINAVDLSLPAVGGASAATVHDPRRDQTGEIAVAAKLDSWVTDWIDTRGIGERQPAPTVAVLVHWLTVRLDDASDEHPAIDDFAAEIRELLAAMRHAVSTATPHGVDYAAPCPRCGTQTLRRRVGADWIECETCGRLWGESDYAALVRDTIPADTLLSVAQAALLLGVTRDAVYKRIARGQLEVVHADPIRMRKGAVDTVTRLGRAAA